MELDNFAIVTINPVNVSTMNKENSENAEALQIRIEACEIKNEALRLKVEALELLNRNLLLLRDVKQQVGLLPKAETARPAEPAAGALSRTKNEQAAEATNVEEMEAAEEKNDDEAGEDEENAPAPKKRGRKPKSETARISRLQVPLNEALREMLKDGNYNKATFRALTGIMLCLFENKTANVSLLHEYIGGSRVTVVRHTALLKKMDLLRYEGSRKKGHYALTDNGKNLLTRLQYNAAA
jgi:hypothetical protein